MTDLQKMQIQNLRSIGLGYGKIAEKLGISPNTVKTYCRRNGLGGVAKAKNEMEDITFCQCCGNPVKQNPGRKKKRFCCDKCRNRWWNANLEKVNRKANYEVECRYCKKMFISYGNKNRKYCSHGCYILDRFGGGDCD